MTQHYISWWNVENLFDTENSSNRPELIAKNSSVKRYLKGWDTTILSKKIVQLGSVIKQINDNQGPDIIGFCEIENAHVMELLRAECAITGRDYKVLHHDMNDARGIDIALMYDANMYEPVGKTFSLEVRKRSSTRDIYQASLKTKKGNSLTILGNHWPARLGGKYESEPYRILVAETLSYWIGRIQEELEGDKTAILCMGDFNDEPFDRSLDEYALSTRVKTKVTRARNPALYNLMWEVMGKSQGSYVYNGFPQVIDQFLVTKGLLSSSSPLKVAAERTKVEHFEGMTSGLYRTPVRFSAPSKGSQFNPEGYSDHLPISTTLMEK